MQCDAMQYNSDSNDYDNDNNNSSNKNNSYNNNNDNYKNDDDYDDGGTGGGGGGCNDGDDMRRRRRMRKNGNNNKEIKDEWIQKIAMKITGTRWHVIDEKQWYSNTLHVHDLLMNQCFSFITFLPGNFCCKASFVFFTFIGLDLNIII